MRGTMEQREVIGSYGDLDPEAVEVAAQAARRTWGMYRDFVELSDLESEAYALILSDEGLMQFIADGNYGYLQHALEQDLRNHCEMAFRVPRNDVQGQVIRPAHTAIVQQGRIGTNANGEKVYERTHVSRDQQLDEAAEEEERVTIYPDTVPGDYTEDQVRLLLPAVWDESYAYSLPDRDDAPDKDMPKAASNKARSNNHWAYIADIKTGWKRTDLTTDERRVIILQFGLGWSQRDIAFNQGVDQSTVSRRTNNAVKKITAHLNGVLIDDDDS